MSKCTIIFFAVTGIAVASMTHATSSRIESDTGPMGINSSQDIVVVIRAVDRQAVRDLIAQAMNARNREPLDPVRREQFVQDVATLMTTWMCGTREEYDELMRSWGGVYRFKDREGVPGATWRAPDEPLAVRSVDLRRCAVRVISKEDLARGVKLAPMDRAGRPGMMTVSMYDFGEHPFELMKPGHDTVEALVPLMTNDGIAIDMLVWMVWSDRSNRWIPCFADMRGEEGKPLPLIIF